MAYNYLSLLFYPRNWVRENPSTSPFLFNFTISYILETNLTKWGSSSVDLQPEDKFVGLDYKDDIILVYDDTQSMQSALN